MPRGLGRQPKARNWCFTLNNPNENDLESERGIEILVKSKMVDYYIAGREKGENETPHHQGFIRMKNNCTMNFVKNILGGRVHVEAAVTLDEAINYCTKECGDDFVEFGTRPNQARANAGKQGADAKAAKAATFIADVRKGCTNAELAEANPWLYLQHHRHLDVLRESLLPGLEHTWAPTKAIWLWGTTGVGKSRWAREQAPSEKIYWKDPNTKWWDGVSRAHELIILDDVDATHRHLYHALKVWSDGYPFAAEIKGGYTLIRVKTMIVTSNYSLEEFCGTDEVALATIGRRFEVIKKTEPFREIPELSLSVSSSAPKDNLVASELFCPETQPMDQPTESDLEWIECKKKEMNRKRKVWTPERDNKKKKRNGKEEVLTTDEELSDGYDSEE